MVIIHFIKKQKNASKQKKENTCFQLTIVSSPTHTFPQSVRLVEN